MLGKPGVNASVIGGACTLMAPAELALHARLDAKILLHLLGDWHCHVKVDMHSQMVLLCLHARQRQQEHEYVQMILGRYYLQA